MTLNSLKRHYDLANKRAKQRKHRRFLKINKGLGSERGTKGSGIETSLSTPDPFVYPATWSIGIGLSRIFLQSSSLNPRADQINPKPTGPFSVLSDVVAPTARTLNRTLNAPWYFPSHLGNINIPFPNS